MRSKEHHRNQDTGSITEYNLPDYWDEGLEKRLVAPFRAFCTGYKGEISVKIEEQEDKITITCQKNGGEN